jgi:hypothetical protein
MNRGWLVGNDSLGSDVCGDRTYIPAEYAYLAGELSPSFCAPATRRMGTLSVAIVGEDVLMAEGAVGRHGVAQHTPQ